MIEWSEFSDQPEPAQARMLLDVASAAWTLQTAFGDVKAEVQQNLALGYEVLSGRHEKLPQLINFLDDPEMAHDFSALYERVKNDEAVSAALDLASYACGFVARIVAEQCKYGPLPDPVLESLPEIYGYYQERAEYLGL